MIGPLHFPLVSVIVVNWNGKHLLETCLGALAAQTFQDFELIVVDNGSSDGSAEWVALHYPGARLIRLEGNCGFSGGNNVGLRAARGEFVALLNNDVEAAPGWLEALLRTMAAHPEVGACDSKVFFYDRRDVLWAAGGEYTISGSVVHRGYRQRDGDGRYSTEADVFIAIASAALYRRTALEQVGLFDEDFFSGYEDVDLSFRLHAAGYRVLNAPRAVAFHRVSETARVNSEFYVFHGQKNVLFTFLKNMPAPLLVKYLPLHLIYTLGSLAYFARQRRLRAALRGKLAVLRQWREIMRKRRAVQRLRTAPSPLLDGLMSRSWLGPKLDKLLR